MTKDDCVKLLKDYMDVLKVDYGIKSISLFGSTARGEQTVNSDIDLFVDTQTPNPFKLMDAREFLERITGLPEENLTLSFVRFVRQQIKNEYQRFQ